MSFFEPDYYASSVLDVPISNLKQLGIKGLIIDLDNTLTNWNCNRLDPKVEKWLNNLLDKNIKVCIVSNNGFKRINNLLHTSGIPFIAHAFKPSKRAFKRAMHVLDTEESNTAIIGDQIFTDIFGGKRLGLTTILVPPLSNREFIGTKVLRLLEKIIFKRYNKI